MKTKKNQFKKGRSHILAKRKFLWLLLPLFLLTILVTACTNSSSSNAKQLGRVKTVRQSKSRKENKRMEPTFFFHGYGSSVSAETHMTNAAVKRGVTHDILTVLVHSNGRVTVRGKIARNSRHPIIKVGLLDNTNPNYRIDARYAYNAVKTIQNRYHFSKMNLVGHSMGNMDIMFMLLYYGHRRGFPRLDHQVDIAGHFNGIRGFQSTAYSHVAKNGKPRRMDSDYRQLLKLRKTYPRASVMNIYGDLENGTHSDRDVTIYSAKSLKYLVSPRARHYEEHEMKGPNAEHSKLHHNTQVDRLLLRFLWHK